MFWIFWCRSFIKLIGGFILSRYGLIYTCADNWCIYFNISIAGNCKIIKIMMKQLHDLSSTGVVVPQTRFMISSRHVLAQLRGICWWGRVWSVRPGSAAAVIYTFITATRCTTSETFAHSLPVVTAKAIAVGAKAGIVAVEAEIYM